jgi:chemotaxis-related protein WspB
MIALTFEVAGQKYGLNVTEIVEVLPMLPLRRLAHVPEYVSGVFRYRGAMVPVIDLSQLIGGRAAAPLLSTRIVVVRHPGPAGSGRALGLLAERATNLDENAGEPASSGFVAQKAPFLGGISGAGSMIQYVNVENLLPDDLRERLFVEE